MAGFVGSIDFNPTFHDGTSQPNPGRQGLHRDYQTCSPYPPLPAVHLEPLGSCETNQVLANEEQTIFLVGAGSISNQVQLRRRLEGRAHRFGSTSSLETAIHLYEDEGARCLGLLNGPFALAIWDQPQRRLILASDAQGQKSIYYSQADQRLVFATRLDAVRKLTNRNQIDASAIDAYVTFGFIPRPLTFIEGIQRLRPGRCLEFEQEQLTIDLFHLWAMPNPLEETDSQRVAGTLREAVRRASEGRCTNVWNDHTLSSRLITAASDGSTADLPIGTVDAKTVVETAELLDEPIASLRPVELRTCLRSSNAEDGVTLTGIGGIEALVLSPHYREFEWMQWGGQMPQSAWQQLDRRYSATSIDSRGYSQQRRRAIRLLNAQSGQSAQRHLRLIVRWSEQERGELYRDEFVERLHNDPARLLNLTPVSASEQGLGAVISRDLLFQVPDRDLAWIDQVFCERKAAYRHPWLDESVLNQSLSLLLKSRWRRNSHRMAIVARLGATFDRRSTNSDAFAAERLCQSELSNFIRDSLLPADALCKTFFSGKTIEAIVNAQLARGGLSEQVVSVLMLELCLRKHRDSLAS